MNLGARALQGPYQFRSLVGGDSTGDAHRDSHVLIVEQGVEK
jgi:hypothetical protein